MTDQPHRPPEKTYSSEQIDVMFSPRRCIHAEQCVHNLKEVFDPAKRPWINPSASTGETVKRVVELCPSGALHTNQSEAIPTENTIRLWINGPLQFKGDLQIKGADTNIPSETRATLCRCGASKSKPFCDNSHRDIAFTTADPAIAISDAQSGQGGNLSIESAPNGPLLVNGNVEIRNAQNAVIYHGSDTALCRCGASGNKPFCDGTHTAINFQAD